MNINENFLMLLSQLSNIIYTPLNRLLILSISAQIASMIIKLIIYSIKYKKFTLKNMAAYGGMPSSHTSFIMSFVFGVGFDPKLGFLHPLFALSLIISSIILVDTIRLRGTIDKLNNILHKLIDTQDKKIKKEIVLPNFIAHKVTEVVSGIIFALLYTFLFYLFFYNIFQ